MDLGAFGWSKLEKTHPDGEGLPSGESEYVDILRAAPLQLAVNVIGNCQLLSQQDYVPGYTSSLANVVQGQSDHCPRKAWTVPRHIPH